jgi:hypothetical protein
VFLDKKSQQLTVGYIITTDKFPFADEHLLSICSGKVITCVLPEKILNAKERNKNIELDYEFFRQLDVADNPVLCIHTLKNK